MDAIYTEWCRFVEGLPPSGTLRDVVLASWERSRAAGVRASGVDPGVCRVPPAELERRLTQRAELLVVTRPHLEWLRTALSGISHVAYVVDADGIVLDVVASDPQLCEEWGLVPGADRSEARMGTNGAGTAIAAERPVVVVGSEHYKQAFSGATCMAAPIHAPDGSVIGAVDLCTHAADARPDRLAIVAHIAFVIERELTFREQQRYGETLAALASLQRVTEAALEHLDVAALAESAVGRVRAVFRADAAAFLLFESGALRVAAVEGFSAAKGDVVPQTPAVARALEADAGPAVLTDALEVGALGTWAATFECALIAPLVASGRPIGVAVLASRRARSWAEHAGLADIAADRVALGIERARRHEAEQRARTDAEATNRAKDEFLATLGHELRNPLGAITSAVHVLDRVGSPDATAVQARDIIARQARRLGRLVDDLLDVARVSTGKIVLDAVTCDLATVVRQALSALSMSGATDRHAVQARLTSAPVRGDTARLEQITTNLVVNATKFTPTGGRIFVTVAADGADAVLRVADEGVGIDASLLPTIFDMFVQGGSCGAPRGGLGIGLALVRRLVELHGGTVSADSPGAGRGSTFTVRLPLIEAVSRRAVEIAAATTVSRGPRVLLVEDDPDVRATLRTALQLSGHEVHEAVDGGTAIDAAVELRPDVVLVDIGLPDISGHEVAHAVRARVPAPIKIVALSGYGLTEDRARSSAAGFDAHLVKPIDPSVLSEFLAELMRPGAGV